MKDYKELLHHIIEEIEFVEINCKSKEYSAYSTDEVLKRATVRSIEIIGETVKNIPQNVISNYPEIEWKNIARSRDKLIHHYFGVDYQIVWDIIRVHLPKLKIAVNSILENSGK
jgi:uncharacterized protein with HEPN domain